MGERTNFLRGLAVLKIVVIILCVIDVLLLWLLFMNRVGPKIFETVLTITLVMIGGLVFATMEQKVKKDFNSAYFVSNTDLVPVFFLGDFVFQRHYMDQAILFEGHMKRLEEQYKIIPFNYRLSEYKPLIDLQTIAILDHLAKYYGRHWFNERHIIDLPMGTSITTKRKENIKEVDKDIAIYKKENLPGSLNENMFFKDFNPPLDAIALPKHTRIDYSFADGKFPVSKIKFTKPLWFEITITIRFSVYTVGLGKIQKMVYRDRKKDKLNFDAQVERQNMHGSVVLNVTCEAKFNRFLSGNPSMVSYREWASWLFDDLSNRFDWSHFEKEIKDHQQSLATDRVLETFR